MLGAKLMAKLCKSAIEATRWQVEKFETRVDSDEWRAKHFRRVPDAKTVARGAGGFA